MKTCWGGPSCRDDHLCDMHVPLDHYLEKHRPWSAGPASSLLPAAGLSPVLTPGMVVARPFCPGTPGDKMHRPVSTPPPLCPREISQTPAGAPRSFQMQTRMRFRSGFLSLEYTGHPRPPAGVGACQSCGKKLYLNRGKLEGII